MATGVVVATSAVAFLIHEVLPVESLALVFLVGVLIVAIRLGRWPSIYASVCSFLVYNFVFTEPYFTLNVGDNSIFLTLVLFLIVAILTGNLAARLQVQLTAQRNIARRTANLYEFSRKIAAAASFEDVVWAAVYHVASTLQCSALVLRPNDSGSLEVAGGYPPEDQLNDRDWGAAKWAWQHLEPAGWSSQTLPSASWLFLPLKTTQGPQALVGVSFDGGRQLRPEDRRLLDALVDQVAVAIERAKLTADIEQSRVQSETERLRGALLSSVSQDLNTPLASILETAKLMRSKGEPLSKEECRTFTETIIGEGERLSRYVKNLLDMTRISYGALSLRLEWIELSSLVNGAKGELRDELEPYRIETNVPLLLPAVKGDPTLLKQALVNVLDNATRYAPMGSEIRIMGTRTGEAVLIAIEDEGPGIPEADRDRVFDMFYRVRDPSGKAKGTGVGLAISRGIIEAHGGTIRASAGRNNRGTRIEIDLPLSGPLSKTRESTAPA